jgi:hypothetical protein
MQTIKEEWIKIYLLDNNSMLDIVFCTTKDYLPSCDNNEVFHIPASFKLFQVNPYLTTMKLMPQFGYGGSPKPSSPYLGLANYKHMQVGMGNFNPKKP